MFVSQYFELTNKTRSSQHPPPSFSELSAKPSSHGPPYTEPVDVTLRKELDFEESQSSKRSSFFWYKLSE